MTKSRQWLILSGIILSELTAGSVWALPGQSSNEVASWIKSNPNLTPNGNERLQIQKRNTAAQVFQFTADLFPPGYLTASKGDVIRAERMELFDQINGVDRDGLEEILREIYGQDIYQDYYNAQVVYTYPSAATITQAINRHTPLLAARQGELRSGIRYAYWIEIAKPEKAQAVTGKIVVFLKEDLNDLESYLRNR